jgi:hypothetical protein
MYILSAVLELVCETTTQAIDGRLNYATTVVRFL